MSDSDHVDLNLSVAVQWVCMLSKPQPQLEMGLMNSTPNLELLQISVNYPNMRKLSKTILDN